MPRLVVTVNDSAMVTQLRTAISQLHGVEHVSMLRETSVEDGALEGELHNEWCRRIDELERLSDGWDGTGSKAIDKQCVKKLRKTISKASESQLEGWDVFPDAHGFLYLDFSAGQAIAGITATADKLIYFIQKSGKIQKSDGIAFTTSNLLSLLRRVNG